MAEQHFGLGIGGYYGQEANYYEEAVPITDEVVEIARKTIGMPYDRGVCPPKNRVASADAIRRYAFGIGDDNPLHRDEEYAKRSPHGTFVAPPTFLFSVDDTIVLPQKEVPGFPYMNNMYGGNTWEFDRPILAGEEIRTKITIADIKDIRGKRIPRMILVVGEVLYVTPSGERLARATCDMLKIPREKGKGAVGYNSEPAYQYTSEEMAKIEHDILAEERRGAKPRYWEDVQVGDAMAPVVKGPLGVKDMVLYYVGNGMPTAYKPLEIAVRYPPEYPPSLGHIVDSIGRQAGMPGAYDIGHQRISWIGHLLSNWMGDHGFVRGMKIRIDLPNCHGDTLWCKGTVTGKRIDERGEALVDCAVQAVNQRDKVTASGTATIRLPGRGQA